MSLLRSASLVSVMTLVSRISGLVREQMVAGLFGANALTDAFLVAFRIPNLLRRLFAEGAFSQAFIPALAASRTRDGDQATHELVDAVATVLLWVLAGTCVVGIVAAPLLVWLLGSGLPDTVAPGALVSSQHAAAVMTRLMFPYIGCMSLVALSAGVLNTWKHFMVPAATPVLLNLSCIVIGYALAGRMPQWGHPGIYAMALGVMLGGVLQLAVQIPALARVGMLPRVGLSLATLRRSWRNGGVQQVLRMMGPALLGVGVSQLSLLINTQISSHIGEGATSWLNYADRLMEFPIGLLGVALGVVLTPQLASAQAAADEARYSSLLDWGLRMTLLLALPCAVALLVFAEPLVAVLYHRGAFHDADVANTARAVMGWGVGLTGLIAIKVLAPGFFARQDTGTPARIAVLVLVLTQLLNLVLVPLCGVAGLALSIGLAALVNATILLRGLIRRGAYRPGPGWLGFVLRILLAALAMGLLQAWLAGAIDWVGLRRHELLRAGYMALSLSASALVYFAVLALSGLPLREFARRH